MSDDPRPSARPDSEVADYPYAAVPRHFIRPCWGFLGKITVAAQMKSKPRRNSKPLPPLGSFNAQEFLDTAGVSRKVMEYNRNEPIYSQGQPAETVMYVQKGGVKLSVVSGSGKEGWSRCLFPATSSARAAWPVKRCAWEPPPPRRRQRCWSSRNENCCGCCTPNTNYPTISSPICSRTTFALRKT